METVEFVEEVAGIYIRSVLLQEANLKIDQHVHDYDHATLVCAGSVRLYVDGVPHGVFKGGEAVCIKAGKKHEFVSLEPNTRLACIHDVASAMSIKERGL
jgi:quercetin dioxygenase-like cupin family protein